MYQRHGRGHAADLANGRTKRNAAPPSLRFSAQMRPPYISTMVRAIERPRPVPCCLVVTNEFENFLEPALGNARSVVQHRNFDLGFADLRGPEGHPPAGRDILHGVHSVQRQIEQNLLQMHVIGANGQRLRGLIAVDLNAAPGRFRLDNLKHVGDRTVDADCAGRDVLGSQKAAQMADDFSGPLVILADIGKYFLELLDIERAFGQQNLGGSGVVQDRAQRLVEFMRNRARHRADGQRAVHLRKLEKSPSGCGFRAEAPKSLEKQR